ncbi:Biotin carboxyl carrier protein of acetyl-CoA carboxylase [Parachlamydia sp. AcF125]|nr:Biotin carboxyl carrier protein of acetyl-CoA carboxylase [Parachlamydia sp. AcF125]
MAAMGRSDMKELFIKEGDFELRLERGAAIPFLETEFTSPPPHFAAQYEEAYHRSSRSPSKAGDIPSSLHTPIPEEVKSESLPGTYVKSPMVGTFYSSPAPDEPTFVKKGDVITKDTVVCIIEAMKVMNEVKAGVEGIVVEVLVTNGQPVEFGTKLIEISSKK